MLIGGSTSSPRTKNKVVRATLVEVRSNFEIGSNHFNRAFAHLSPPPLAREEDRSSAASKRGRLRRDLTATALVLFSLFIASCAHVSPCSPTEPNGVAVEARGGCLYGTLLV